VKMDYFLDAYREYANFQGRASRQQYWMFYLFYMIAYILLFMLDVMIGTTGLLSGLFALGSFIPSIAIAARRLHDTNRTGWWQLLLLVPIIGGLVLLFFLVSKGTEGENRFGFSPL
jgi:uncharacterized membrane protein YhaH (DUF805 family)